MAGATRKFKVLNSSAGSGKTYNLTKEYLKLALSSQDPEYFKSILAITFTNDAASEMKERILYTLQAFSTFATLQDKEKKKVENLLEEIYAELKTEYPQNQLTKSTLLERAGRLFHHILYNYSDFSVSTIDSFVNKVVSSFTKELSLPYNFQVDLDSQALLSSAVDLMLSRVNKTDDKLLSETLEQYALEKAEKGNSWNNLPNELVEFAQNLLNEQVYEAVSELNNLTLDDFRNIRQQLQTYLQKTDKIIQALGQQALGTIDEQGLEPKNFYQGTKGIYGFFARCSTSGIEKSQQTNSYILATVNDDKWYTDKKAIEANNKVDGIKGGLLNLYGQIMQASEANFPQYKLVQAVLPHLYKLSLLNEIRRHLIEIQDETSRIHISEFNKRIVDIVLNEPVPFIYERMGQRYRHILIDEFQDTSTLQWNNLLPLIDNSLGDANFNMVVGDAKQAIYRWRGGEMEQIIQLYRNETKKLTHNKANQLLLEERYYTLNQHLYPADLNINYRSAAEIIEFNNHFFSQISSSRPDLEMLQNIYSDRFEQQSPPGHERKGGHVEILFVQEGEIPPAVPHSSTDQEIPYDSGLTYLENTLQVTLQLINNAIEDGYSRRDIALLHRTNKNARLTANFLKENGFDIISQDSLSLQFSETVNFIVAIFKVYVQPTDAIAKSEALYLFHKVVRKEIPTTEQSLVISGISRGETELQGPETDASEAFFHYFASFGFIVPRYDSVQLSIYQSTEQLLHTFGLYHCCPDADYLFRFLDVVLEFSFTASNNLSDFLDYWKRNKEKISINTPQDRDAITVTTIHKSKGLAFPVVIVPFCDWQFAPYTSALVWSRLENGLLPAQLPGEQKEALRAVVTSATSALAGTVLEPNLQTELEKTFIENFNMLYVAFTRPEDRLYIISNFRDFSDSRQQKTAAYLLYLFLTQQGIWQETERRFVIANGSEPQSHRRPRLEKPFVVEHATGADWTTKMKLKRHAANVFDLATLDPALEEQNKIIYALCKLHYADELPAVMQELLNEGIVHKRELQQLQQKVEQFLQHKHIGNFFSRDFTIELNKEVVSSSGKIYKPSRVVSKEGNLYVLEFKCGLEDPMTAEEVKEYAGTLQKLGYAVARKMIIYTEPLRVLEV